MARFPIIFCPHARLIKIEVQKDGGPTWGMSPVRNNVDWRLSPVVRVKFKNDKTIHYFVAGSTLLGA